MRRGLIVVVAAGACGCARPRVGPPALFPVATAWVATAEDAIEPPLASDGARVFVATRAGTLNAFGPSGETLWTARAAGRLSAAPGTLVVVQPDGVVRRLDPDTGAPRWDAATGVSGAHPAVLDGERILLAGTGLAELDAATGRVLWAAEDAPRCLAPPAPAGRLVLTSEQDGRLCARERGTGRRAWCRGVGGLPAAPAADARRAYVGTTDRRVLALDLKDGAIDWRFKVGADVGAAPALAGGRVLVAAFDAVLYALGAGNGHMQWRAPLPSRPLSGPLLVGDSVLVACHETELVGFDGRTGRALGSLRAPAELRTGPLLVGDRAYLGLRDRSLVALTLDMTPAKDLPLGRPAARPPRRQRERSLNP